MKAIEHEHILGAFLNLLSFLSYLISVGLEISPLSSKLSYPPHMWWTWRIVSIFSVFKTGSNFCTYSSTCEILKQMGGRRGLERNHQLWQYTVWWVLQNFCGTQTWLRMMPVWCKEAANSNLVYHQSNKRGLAAVSKKLSTFTKSFRARFRLATICSMSLGEQIEN